MLGIFTSASLMAQKTVENDKYHSRLGFDANHFGISKVEGNFKDFDATMKYSKADFSDAVFTVVAKIASINTEVDMRDNHLKSADFFDAEKFTTLTFTSTSLKKVKGNQYKLNGKLTMHGVTKNVVFDLTYNGKAVTASKKMTAGFTITGSLNRLDYGVGTSIPEAVVGNKIQLVSNVEFPLD